MSKRYDEFEKRLNLFCMDIDLVEYIANNHLLLCEDRTCKDGLFNKSKEKKRYAYISTIANSSELKDAIYHLQHTLYASFIKDLYEEVFLYLHDILLDVAECHKRTPAQIMIQTKEVSLDVKDLLVSKSYDEMMKVIVDALFRSMEKGKSTISLIQNMNTKLGLKIDKKKLDDALVYLELRNTLTHSDGRPDKKSKLQPRKNEESIRLTHKRITEALASIKALVWEIDSKYELISCD